MAGGSMEQRPFYRRSSSEMRRSQDGGSAMMMTTSGRRRQPSIGVETVYQRRQIPDRTLTQPIFIRYLQPPINGDETKITEVDLPQQTLPPILLVQKDEQVSSPEPIIYRELPPTHAQKQQVIHVRKGERPPRPIVIERIPKLQEKPPPILIERWLPRPPPKIVPTQSPQQQQKKESLKRKVLVVERSAPNVRIVKEFINLGTRKVSEEEYMNALARSAKKASACGRSIFIESTVDKEAFEQQISSHPPPSQDTLTTADMLNPVTILGVGEVRI